MGKAKTKRAAFDTTCTQSVNGSWRWEVDGRTWIWRESAGINTGVLNPSGEEVGLIFSRTLDHAVCFSNGWAAGESHARREAT